MLNKFVYIFFIGLFIDTSLPAQELAATITIQSSKVDNQVDAKLFPELQTQLKDFINQRKWSSDVFAAEEKIDCNFLLLLNPLYRLVFLMPN